MGDKAESKVTQQLMGAETSCMDIALRVKSSYAFLKHLPETFRLNDYIWLQSGIETQNAIKFWRSYILTCFNKKQKKYVQYTVVI